MRLTVKSGNHRGIWSFIRRLVFPETGAILISPLADREILRLAGETGLFSPTGSGLRSGNVQRKTGHVHSKRQIAERR